MLQGLFLLSDELYGTSRSDDACLTCRASFFGRRREKEKVS